MENKSLRDYIEMFAVILRNREHKSQCTLKCFLTNELDRDAINRFGLRRLANLHQCDSMNI